jgi:hypothetical protein
MHRGSYQLGESVPLAVLCRNTSQVPADPDACPQVEIFGEGGERASAKLAIQDPAATTGFFAGKLYLSSLFTPGEYTAVYRWDISGTRLESEDTFSVVAGGDGSGAVIALHTYERPQANFLVQQRQDGQMYKGKNPRL